MRDQTFKRKQVELISRVINSLDFNGIAVTTGTIELIRLTVAKHFAARLPGANKEMFIEACTLSDRKRAEKLTKRADAVATDDRPRSSGEPAFYND